jgi:THO complex subunit 2
MIPFVIDSFKYLTKLSFDTVVYTLLDLMSNTEKQKLKSDGVNIAGWFQNLSCFCGSFYRKYPHVELQALLQFVANQLKDGSSLDLIVLRQLVTNMSSVVVLEAMSEEQLLSIGGSRTLRDVVIESQQTKSRIKKTAPYLRSALIDGNLVSQLFILMAQMKKYFISNSPFRLLIALFCSRR